MRHTLKDILVIVLFATLANADNWVEMALFAEDYQDYQRKYIELKNGPPSHDTIRRGMGMISPEILQQLYTKWQEWLNRNDGELLKKIICIDGKTMWVNKRKEEKSSHIVSAWSKEDVKEYFKKRVFERNPRKRMLQKDTGKSPQPDRDEGVLSDRGYRLAWTKERMEWFEKYCYGEENPGERWDTERGISLFYKQFERRY